MRSITFVVALVLSVWRCSSFVNFKNVMVSPMTSRGGIRYQQRVSRHQRRLHVSFFDRAWRVVKSNVNSILQYFEDPEKILEQAVEDMNSDLIRVKQSYCEVAASCLKMKLQRDKMKAKIELLQNQAKYAVNANKESLAKEALQMKYQLQESCTTLDQSILTQEAAEKKIKSAIESLESKIFEARQQKDGYIARSKAAKSSLLVNEMLTGIVSSAQSSSAHAAFENMKEKVETLELQVGMSEQQVLSSSGDTSVDRQLKQLAVDSQIDEELQRMKSSSRETYVLGAVDYEFVK